MVNGKKRMGGGKGKIRRKRDVEGHMMRGTITMESEMRHRAIIHNTQCRASTGGCLVTADI